MNKSGSRLPVDISQRSDTSMSFHNSSFVYPTTVAEEQYFRGAGRDHRTIAPCRAMVRAWQSWYDPNKLSYFGAPSPFTAMRGNQKPFQV